MKLSLPKPRDWQKKALTKWIIGDFKGTVKGATGIGKSVLAYMSIYYMLKEAKNFKVMLVVHTTHLQSQHKENLIEYGLEEKDIGLVGDGFQEWSKPITIAVVNSIRFDILKNKHYHLLILDEVHHYFPEINSTFLRAGKFDKILALSATPERDDKLHLEFFKIFPVIFEYNQEDAIKDGLLAPYKIINIGTTLLSREEKQYLMYDNIVSNLFPNYSYSIENIKHALTNRDYNASKLMRAITKRRQIIQNSLSKVLVATHIVVKELIYLNSKIIIFNEFINAVDMLEKRLQHHNINVGVYHSKLKKKERKEILDKFRNDKFRVLIGVKCLDEGLDVPDANIAIIVGGSSSKRQQIQRIGRVLRKRGNKEATVYQIYIKDYKDVKSKDIDWIRSRMRGIKNVSVEWR